MPELPFIPPDRNYELYYCWAQASETQVHLRFPFLMYIKTVWGEGLLSQKEPTMNYQNLAPCVHHYQLTEAWMEGGDAYLCPFSVKVVIQFILCTRQHNTGPQLWYTWINQPPSKWRKTNTTCPVPPFDTVLLGCKGGTGHRTPTICANY